MKIFSINPLMEGIRDAIDAGLDPDPSAVSLLIQEGPKAIEDWCLAIEEVEAEAEVIKTHINGMKARMDARLQAVVRMRGALQDILARHFDGSARTPLKTCWVQQTTSYKVTADPAKAPQFFTPQEPKLKKQEIIDLYKNSATLPEGVTVTPIHGASLRIKKNERKN